MNDNLFKDLFASYNLSEEQIEKYLDGFTVVAILTLVSASASKFSEQEVQVIREALQTQDLSVINNTITEKYSPEELRQLIDTHIVPLVDDYITNVVTEQ